MRCSICNGFGFVDGPIIEGSFDLLPDMVKCERCKGTGKVESDGGDEIKSQQVTIPTDIKT